MRFAPVLPILAALAAAPGAAQQPDTTRLPATVVTATRVPVASAAVPASVTVLTGDELRARGIVSIADALRTVPGVALAQSGSFGALTSLFLRGGESKYVKVLVDGVAVNDPGGAYDFGTLTTDNVERIEVVRGPTSVVWGADAVTGVIQIFTRRGHGPLRANASARGGSYGSSDVEGTVQGGFAAGDVSFAAARHGTRGIYDFNNAYTSNVASGGMHVALDSLTDLRATVRYTDYVFHYPTNGGGTPVDSNAKRAQDNTTIGVEVGRRVSKQADVRLAVTTNGTAGGTDDRPDTPQASGLQTEDRIRRRGADLRANLELPAATLVTVGAEVEQEDQRTETESIFGGSGSTSVFAAARRNAAAYAELLANLPSTVVSAGARLDDNERFGTFGTYRLGTSWSSSTGTRVRGSLGTAFREPSFFENYATGFVTGNPGLAPERATSWELGLGQSVSGERAYAGVTYFSQRFRNMIDYTGSTTACGASYCNVARAEANGVEVEARATLLAGLDVDANATFLDTRVQQAGFDTSSAGLYRAGQTLIRRPRTTVNAGVSYRASRGSVDLHVSRIGRRDDRDFRPYPAAPVVDPAYTLADAGAEFVIVRSVAGRPGASVTLRAENVFDAHYESVFNFRSPRRTILGGARLSF